MKRSIPFSKFFGEMNLTKKQREDREKAAKDTEEVLLILFLVLLEQRRNHSINYEYARNEFIKEYTEVVGKYTDREFADIYVPLVAADIINTTQKHPGDEWYLSDDRAAFIAENEALSVLNHQDYKEATDRGFTRKRWDDVKDNRERDAHILIGGTTIPINQKFHVGDDYMEFPHDYINGSPENLVNCRCHITYLR